MGDMNAPLRTRIREGCRGGQEQFTWNSIKDQDYKDREQYLGATVKVGMMGKFGRYQLHDWYARKRDTPESIDKELSSVQAYEEELMKEALGLKPKKLMLAKRQLTEEELQEVLKRDSDKSSDKKGRTQMGPQGKLVTNEYGEQVTTSNEEVVAVAAREAPIKGLGFAMHRTAKLEAIKAETLGTESQLEGSGPASSSGVKKEEVKDEEEEGEAAGSSLGVVDARVKEERAPKAEVKRELPDGEPSRKRHKGGEEAPEDERHRKKDKKDKEAKKRKKAEKKLKKIEKKIKKAAKKEKRAARRAKQENASSSSSSSSS